MEQTLTRASTHPDQDFKNSQRSGAVQQQDQRRDAAAFPGAGQPRAARAAGPHHRRGLADRPGAAARARAVRRRLLVPGAVARYQAQQQGASRDLPALGGRCRVESRLDVRRPGQAHPRVQAPASQLAAHRRAVLPAQAEPRAVNSAAGLHLRRQGSSGLLHGQANHQADQRRWRRRSTATRRSTSS